EAADQHAGDGQDRKQRQLPFPRHLRRYQHHDADNAGGDAKPEQERAGRHHFDGGQQDTEDEPVPVGERFKEPRHVRCSPPAPPALLRPPHGPPCSFSIALRASSAMPPMAPMTLDASSGMKMSLPLRESAMACNAST